MWNGPGKGFRRKRSKRTKRRWSFVLGRRRTHQGLKIIFLQPQRIGVAWAKPAEAHELAAGNLLELLLPELFSQHTSLVPSESVPKLWRRPRAILDLRGRRRFRDRFPRPARRVLAPPASLTPESWIESQAAPTGPDSDGGQPPATVVACSVPPADKFPSMCSDVPRRAV